MASSSGEEAVLTAEDVVLAYGGTEVLRGVRLAVAESEVVAVTGPSGSGKSTLLFCLAGLMRPGAGSVAYRGRRLETMSDRALSALRLGSFGFVFQFGDLVPELTVVENVELPLRFAGAGRRAARRAGLEALDLLGVSGLADRRTHEVSGGELQRAAVARALVHEPGVVFADEPTGALDEANGGMVLDALLGAARIRRASVVLVTHDPAVAAKADRRVRMRGGRVEAPADQR